MSENKKPSIESYKEIAKNSLVRMQYSCCGNSSSIDEGEYIPIVPEDVKPTE